MKLCPVCQERCLCQRNLNKLQSTSGLIGKTLEYNGFLPDNWQLERVKIPHTCVRCHMGYIKSLLIRTFLKYVGTVDQRKCESKPAPF